jgi:hypothetical protein
MAPDEVRGLQALAMAHGGSLTINPETGLPEAGFLKSLLPAVIGFALNAIAPGVGSAIGSALGASAATAGAIGTGVLVGGVEALRTGDIGRGLSAGLGAYGGAGLAGGMAAAGVPGALNEAAALAGVQAEQQAIAQGLSAETAAAIKAQAIEEAGNAAANSVTRGAAIGTAAKDIASNPMQAVKDYAKPLMYAAGPAIAAGANVQANMPKTTTAPSTAAYRPYSYDPYGGTFESQGVYPINPPPQKAADGGLMGMDDGGYNPGQLDFVQRSEPVVRMADGGMWTPEQFKQNIYEGGVDDSAATRRGLEYAAQQGLNAQQTTDLWNTALGTRFTPDDYAAVMKQYNIAAPTANVDFVKNLATDTSTAADFKREVEAKGLSQQDVNAALASSGLSGAAQFSLTNPNIGDTANTSETYGGLKGLSDNINYWLKNHPGASAQDIRNEMKKWELNDADFIRATGTDVNNYAMGPITKVQQPAEGAGGNTTAVVNENGTITQTAVPTSVTGGQPISTVQQVKDVYTQGGGSTGYVNKAPKDMAEFDTRFNKLTGGSKQAYDYLMGKTPYSATPWTPTGEVMKPYAESVLGVPVNLATKKYLFDPTTKQYKVNPDYQAPIYDPATRERTAGMSSNQILKGLQALPNPSDDKATYDYMIANKLTPEQVAAALGADIALIRAKYEAAKAGSTGGTTGTTGGTTGTTNTVANSTTKTIKPTNDPGPNKIWDWSDSTKSWVAFDLPAMAAGGLPALAAGGMSHLGSYSDGGRLLRGPGDGVSDSIPAVIGKKQPARLADGEFVVPARIVSELGNGSTEAGARKLYAMMDRIQAARRGTVGKGKVAKNSRSEKYLPA